MKKLIVLLSLFSMTAFAQDVNVKNLDASEDTTIQIKKGAKNIDKQFEIVEESEEVEGDSAPLLKDARDNWKKACDKWKAETKKDAKDEGNSVTTIKCGKMTCSTVTMESTCTSEGKYKVKTKIQ